MGYIPAICSVLLVSFAQVAMKFAMSRFPASVGIGDFVRDLAEHLADAGWLLAGLAGYALSMGCWFLALKRLPLSKAYALLSLSYIIVWAAAITLGFQGERFSFTTLAGILSVIVGVMLVCMPSAKR